MSGGHFGWNYMPDDLDGVWRDEEINELFSDLMCGGEFSVRGYGGLFQSLDFWLSSDIGEESYRKAVDAFKKKWMHRTPRNRIEFYQRKLQDYADKLKREMGDV